MYAWMDSRKTRELERGIMTILNPGPPLRSTTMYDLRKRPGGPSGELLLFISDRDITSTKGQGDKTVMLAIPAPSTTLQSKATAMNRRHSECPLCSVWLSEQDKGCTCVLYFHNDTKKC